MGILDRRKILKSDLWLDQADARERIEAGRKQGELTEDEAEKLLQFAEQGFLTFHLQGCDKLFDQALQDVNRLWKERPIDLAYAYTGEVTSMADADEGRERRPLCRILDLHSHSRAIGELYLHPQIFAWTDRVFGQASAAFQSVFFEWGSRLPLHRDAAYIPVQPPSHLLGVWVALEDVHPDSGPLAYIPRSHRLPYFEFEPQRIAIRSQEENYFPAHKFNMGQCVDQGLAEQLFRARRGEVLIWHASLIHGGSRPADSRRSRRSLVVHFSTRQQCKKRSGAYLKKVRGSLLRPEQRSFWATTERLLEANGCVGLDNPLKGLRPRGLSLKEKLKSRFG